MQTFRRWIGAALLALVVTPDGIAAPAATAVRLKTEDGVRIVGDFFPTTERGQAPLAILLHMYRHDRTSWKPLIEPLHQASFAVLAIDLRGHGESIAPAKMRLRERVVQRDPGLFNAMHLDVAAAIEWAKMQGGVDGERMVLVGASVGCSVALDVCARDPGIDAVVCMTPGTNYLGVDSRLHVKKTRKVPILLLATEEERAATDDLAKLAKNVRGEIVGPGKIHGTRMFGKVAGVEKKIADFLTESLKKT
jgi:dienelactone hydrolase